MLHLALLIMTALQTHAATNCAVTDADNICPYIFEAPSGILPKNLKIAHLTTRERRSLRVPQGDSPIVVLRDLSGARDISRYVKYQNAKTLRLDIQSLRHDHILTGARQEISVSGNDPSGDGFFSGEVKIGEKPPSRFTELVPAEPRTLDNLPYVSAVIATDLAAPGVAGLPTAKNRAQNSLSLLFPVNQLMDRNDPFVDDGLNPYLRHPDQFKIAYHVQIENLGLAKLTSLTLQLMDEKGAAVSPTLALPQDAWIGLKVAGNSAAFDIVFDPRDLSVPSTVTAPKLALTITPVGNRTDNGRPVTGHAYRQPVVASYNVSQLGSESCLAYSYPYSTWGTAKLARFVRAFNHVDSYPMYCNDGSYPFGGPFFLPGGRQVHAGHRMGLALDMRSYGPDPENYDKFNAGARQNDIETVYSYVVAHICADTRAADCLTPAQLEACLAGDASCASAPVTEARRLAEWASINRRALLRMKGHPDLGKNLEIIVSSGVISRLSRKLTADSRFIREWQYALLKDGILPYRGQNASGQPQTVRLWWEKRPLESGPLDFILDYPGHLHHMHIYLEGKRTETDAD